MAQGTRFHCDRCGESVYNCLINGVRVPLVLYMVVGQPEDTGPTLEINQSGVHLPQFVREMMKLPIARVEWCMACVIEVFGTPAVPAVPELDGDDDPPFEAGAPEFDGMDKTAFNVMAKGRVMQALAAGQGRDIPRYSGKAEAKGLIDKERLATFQERKTREKPPKAQPVKPPEPEVKPKKPKDVLPAG